MKKFIYKYCIGLSLLWLLIIFGLCSLPGTYIPSVSWLELLSFDKWVHAGMFFILCGLFFVITIKKEQSFYLVFIYFLISVIYGGLLEIMQALFFSHRSSDMQDFIANSFGCLVALIFYKKLKTIFRAYS